jgi:hypothetical protein
VSAALATRPVATPAAAGGLGLVAGLTVGLALVVPYGLVAALGGALVRTVYPAYILLIAAVVLTRRRPLYPAYILGVFAFSPFIRRLADYQAGFSLFNLILLAPYVGLLPTLPALLRRALGAGRVPLGWPFAIMLLCVIYGSFLAMFRLAFVPAIYEALRWLLPVALCAFILERPEQAGEMRRAVLMTLALVLPILTVYGIYQFIAAPLWDVVWLWNIENPTFGEGAPYKIRVWSMMNSPGTVAVFSAFAMLLLAGESVAGMALAATALPLLALTVIRTSWVALAVGLAVLLWKASATSRLGLAAGVAGLGFAMTVLLASHVLPPEITNLVTDRAATFSDLGTDTSTYDRVQVYAAFYDRLSASPWGEGFGVNESTVTRKASTTAVTSIDSGFLETYLIYGVFVGTVYFVALIEVIRACWRALAVLPQRFSGHIALVCAAIAITPLGTIQIGEGGSLVWIAVGLLLASGAARPAGRLLPAGPQRSAHSAGHSAGHSKGLAGRPPVMTGQSLSG